MKKLFCYIQFAVLLLFSCSGMTRHPESAAGELELAAGILGEKITRFNELNSRDYPGNGYFYILDSGGTVVMHPERALIGMDFSRYDFIKQVLKNKKGCLSFVSGERTMNLFFMELQNGDILCFAFETSPGTETYKKCD